MSTPDCVLACRHKYSFLFIVLTAYIVSADGAADTRPKPLRDARMVKMMATATETGAGNYEAVLTDGTQLTDWRLYVQRNRRRNLGMRGNHGHGLMERTHQVTCEVNREVRTRNQGARAGSVDDCANDVEHHHCLSVAIGHDSVPRSLGQVEGKAGKVCLVLNNVSQKRNNVGQHRCLYRTTLKPHAVEDVHRFIRVWVKKLSLNFTLDDYGTQKEFAKLDVSERIEQCAVSLCESGKYSREPLCSRLGHRLVLLRVVHVNGRAQGDLHYFFTGFASNSDGDGSDDPRMQPLAKEVRDSSSLSV